MKVQMSGDSVRGCESDYYQVLNMSPHMTGAPEHTFTLAAFYRNTSTYFLMVLRVYQLKTAAINMFRIS